MERKKVVAVVPGEGEGSHKRCNVQLALFLLERSFTSFRMTKPRASKARRGAEMDEKN
jgi:hypothetical protein